VLGNLVSALLGQRMFDRYWLLVLPPLLAMILSERTAITSKVPVPARVATRLPAAAALAGLAIVSLMITAAGLAHDSARWAAAERVVATGVPATDIDSGLEWNGYHSAVGMSPPGSWNFPGNRACYLVRAEQHPDQDAMMELPYRPLVVAGSARLWVYRQDCD
jgi:hypothetical protein